MCLIFFRSLKKGEERFEMCSSDRIIKIWQFERQVGEKGESREYSANKEGRKETKQTGKHWDMMDNSATCW